jgi:hypothetical protein
VRLVRTPLHHLALRTRHLARGPGPAADGDPLWQGEVDALSASADLQGRARAWIPELLRGFPAAEGLPAERTVEILPPEGD